MTIKELFNKELSYWYNKNIELFGVELINEFTPFKDIQDKLNLNCKKYWNSSKPCELANKLNDGTLDIDYKLRVPKSYRLELNPNNFCIDVFSKYTVNNEDIEYKICAIPTPSDDLTWIINNTHYTPRVTAVSDNTSFIYRTKFGINGEFWKYNFNTQEFTCLAKKNVFDTDINTIFNEHLSLRSKAFLQSLIDNPLTTDNFLDTLELVPSIPYNDIRNYKFSRIAYFKDILFNTYKYAHPIKGILLGINSLFVSQVQQYTKSKESFEGSLVLVNSKIEALEAFRTVINVYKGSYKPVFTYENTNGLFDSFKTATSGEAGRQRMLLDNITIKDGMLFVDDDINMFEALKHPQESRLSCISSSPFCNNDKSKRIMMTGKLAAQAVSVDSEIDDISHRLLARVGFTDINGYTYGDSIIISKSFAERLRTTNKKILTLKRNDSIYDYLLLRYYDDKDYVLNTYDLSLLWPNTNIAILDSYENAKVSLFDYVNDDLVRIFITYEIPFNIGDKLSNLHGAKGVVSKILPDEEMPTLLNKVGNMEPGPLEIIISGFSTIRRGSLGQIFEAWALASGIDIDNNSLISDVADKYAKEIEEFSRNSLVEYNGEINTIPVGINNIIRLYHYASTKVSVSPKNGKFRKLLKLGEMEKLNLVASNSTNILKELSIRSIHKYYNSKKLVDEIEETRTLPKDITLNLRFANILKMYGYSISVDGEPLVKSDLRGIKFSEDVVDGNTH